MNKHIVVPRNHYTQRMYWNEIAYAEGMGGVLGVEILKAVEIEHIYQQDKMIKKAKQILSIIPKEQFPNHAKVTTELMKLADYCNAWAEEEKYMEVSDDNRRIGIDLSMVQYSKYKRLDGEWGEVWLDGYQRAIDDIMKRIDAVRLLDHIVNECKTKEANSQ